MTSVSTSTQIQNTKNPKKEKKVKGDFHQYAHVRRVELASNRLFLQHAEECGDASLMKWYEDMIQTILVKTLQTIKPSNGQCLEQLSDVEEDLTEQPTLCK